MELKQNKKELRQFGMLLGTFFPLLFGLILPWLWGHDFSLLPWILGSVFWVLAIAFPISLQPIYRVWMKIAEILAWVNSRIILGIIFFAMVTPMGFIMRLLQRDPMARKYDRQVATYRIGSQKRSRESMEKPY
ncbi:MAG: sxtJ [Cyanobacteria bacterium SBLK]|nr:sxtJ [Cyanobacteria bacterium SBLK]